MADSLKQTVFVFDFDGVITTLDIDWQNLKDEISNSLGLNIDSFISFFENSWGTPDFDKVNNIVKSRELEAVRTSTLYQDVRPALNLVQSSNCPAYISSMQSIEPLNYFLGFHEIRSYFKEVMGRESWPGKRAQLEHVRELESPSSGRLVFIDDMRRHIATGRELGFESVICSRMDGRPEALLEIVRSFLA